MKRVPDAVPHEGHRQIALDMVRTWGRRLAVEKLEAWGKQDRRFLIAADLVDDGEREGVAL